MALILHGFHLLRLLLVLSLLLRLLLLLKLLLLLLLPLLLKDLFAKVGWRLPNFEWRPLQWTPARDLDRLIVRIELVLELVKRRLRRRRRVVEVLLQVLLLLPTHPCCCCRRPGAVGFVRLFGLQCCFVLYLSLLRLVLLPLVCRLVPGFAQPRFLAARHLLLCCRHHLLLLWFSLSLWLLLLLFPCRRVPPLPLL